jgi:hypothetical protein
MLNGRFNPAFRFDAISLCVIAWFNVNFRKIRSLRYSIGDEPLTALPVASRFALVLLSVMTLSCRTTAPVSTISDNKAGESSAGTQDGANSAAAKERLESASPYSDLRLWERLDTKNPDSPTRAGVVRCSMDHAYISCMVQGSGGVETLLETSVSSGIRLRMVERRKDLEFEPRIVADTFCDRVEARTPPYTGVDAKCRFENIRAYNEALLDGDLALEMSSLIRGDKAFGDSVAEVSGIISCAVRGRKINVHCSARVVSAAGISDDARALSREDSVELSEKMIQTLDEIKKFTRDPAERPLPGELAGSVRCFVENSAVEQNGKREAVCRVRM